MPIASTQSVGSQQVWQTRLKAPKPSSATPGARNPVLHRLVAQQVGAQVLLVVVGEDRDDDGVRAQLVLHLQRAEEVGAGRDAHAEAELPRPASAPSGSRRRRRRSTTSSSDVEIDDRRDELVGDALDAVLARPCGRSRASASSPARADGCVIAGCICRRKRPDAHDRAAGADAGDERVGPQRREPQLPPDLRPGRPLVRLDVVLVRELARQERAGRRRRELLGQADAAEEAALLACSRARSRRRGCGSARSARGSSSPA